jgi:hypothetical protein
MASLPSPPRLITQETCGKCKFAHVPLPGTHPLAGQLGDDKRICYGNPPVPFGILGGRNPDGSPHVIAVELRASVSVDDPACHLFRPYIVT